MFKDLIGVQGLKIKIYHLAKYFIHALCLDDVMEGLFKAICMEMRDRFHYRFYCPDGINLLEWQRSRRITKSMKC